MRCQEAMVEWEENMGEVVEMMEGGGGSQVAGKVEVDSVLAR